MKIEAAQKLDLTTFTKLRRMQRNIKKFWRSTKQQHKWGRLTRKFNHNFWYSLITALTSLIFSPILLIKHDHCINNQDSVQGWKNRILFSPLNKWMRRLIVEEKTSANSCCHHRAWMRSQRFLKRCNKSRRRYICGRSSTNLVLVDKY